MTEYKLEDRNFLVYDLECSFSNSSNAPDDFRELLELGAVIVDSNYQIIDTFQSYIKPVFYPELTPECQELLGDIQQKVDTAEELPSVWGKFKKWLSRYPIGKTASWGISDKTFLGKQLIRYGLETEFLDLEYLDLKRSFRKSRPVKIKPVGLKKASEILGIELAGKHHSALNDAMSALNICKRLNLLGDIDE